MRHAIDPRQKPLFDTAEGMFSSMVLKRCRRGWQEIFRTRILHLMPVGKLGEHFHATLGCTTKELYSMAGALFLKEAFNLTIEKAVGRYMMDAGWHYALNVIPLEAGMSHATIERYMKIFAEDDLGKDIFLAVTTALTEALELDVSRQRLDSTHVFSDMATFGRSKLMGVTIKRFLTQLKRHHREWYDALPDEFRSRYAPAQARLFGDFTGKRRLLRQTVAEDLLFLVNRFADGDSKELKKLRDRSSYQAVCRVLQEQCTVSEDKTELTVEAHPGGDVMQNPSDPDATRDGHKGPGYQAQLCETCGEDNDAQLIVGVEVEGAHESDFDALVPMLDQLEAHGRKPEVVYGDGHYGSDENVVAAEARHVDLQAPVAGTEPQPHHPDALTLDDFVFDEAAETVECCPNGCVPVSSEVSPKTGKTRTVMARSDCSACACRSLCPVKPAHGRYVLYHTAKQRRVAARRAEQATEASREHYRIRGGGESVNSGLKRRMGMGRVRTRGSPRVRLAVFLRCAGWNIFRALAAFKKRGFGAFNALFSAFSQLWPALSRLLAPAGLSCRHLPPFCRPSPPPAVPVPA